MHLPYPFVPFNLVAGEEPVPAVVTKINDDGSLDLSIFTGDPAQPVRVFQRRLGSRDGSAETWVDDSDLTSEPAPAPEPA